MDLVGNHTTAAGQGDAWEGGGDGPRQRLHGGVDNIGLRRRCWTSPAITRRQSADNAGLGKRRWTSLTATQQRW
uniref:Uncharacterized protein n=1 Tax=Oryza barthii TaxID=65489 RepID=A0A0D3EV67_9ORYZ